MVSHEFVGEHILPIAALHSEEALKSYIQRRISTGDITSSEHNQRRTFLVGDVMGTTRLLHRRITAQIFERFGSPDSQLRSLRARFNSVEYFNIGIPIVVDVQTSMSASGELQVNVLSYGRERRVMVRVENIHRPRDGGLSDGKYKPRFYVTGVTAINILAETSAIGTRQRSEVTYDANNAQTNNRQPEASGGNPWAPLQQPPYGGAVNPPNLVLRNVSFM